MTLFTALALFPSVLPISDMTLFTALALFSSVSPTPFRRLVPFPIALPAVLPALAVAPKKLFAPLATPFKAPNIRDFEG